MYKEELQQFGVSVDGEPWCLSESAPNRNLPVPVRVPQQQQVLNQVRDSNSRPVPAQRTTAAPPFTTADSDLVANKSARTASTGSSRAIRTKSTVATVGTSVVPRVPIYQRVKEPEVPARRCLHKKTVAFGVTTNVSQCVERERRNSSESPADYGALVPIRKGLSTVAIARREEMESRQREERKERERAEQAQRHREKMEQLQREQQARRPFQTMLVSRNALSASNKENRPPVGTTTGGEAVTARGGGEQRNESGSVKEDKQGAEVIERPTTLEEVIEIVMLLVKRVNAMEASTERDTSRVSQLRGEFDRLVDVVVDMKSPTPPTLSRSAMQIREPPKRSSLAGENGRSRGRQCRPRETAGKERHVDVEEPLEEVVVEEQEDEESEDSVKNRDKSARRGSFDVNELARQMQTNDVLRRAVKSVFDRDGFYPDRSLPHHHYPNPPQRRQQRSRSITPPPPALPPLKAATRHTSNHNGRRDVTPYQHNPVRNRGRVASVEESYGRVGGGVGRRDETPPARRPHRYRSPSVGQQHHGKHRVGGGGHSAPRMQTSVTRRKDGTPSRRRMTERVTVERVHHFDADDDDVDYASDYSYDEEVVDEPQRSRYYTTAYSDEEVVGDNYGTAVVPRYSGSDDDDSRRGRRSDENRSRPHIQELSDEEAKRDLLEEKRRELRERKAAREREKR